MKTQKLTAARGWYWISNSFVLFKKRPSVFASYFLVTFVLWYGVIRLPMIGNLLVTFVTPLFTAALACHVARSEADSRSRSLRAELLPYVPQLLRVGGIYAGGLIVAGALVAILTRDSVLAMALLGDPAAIAKINVDHLTPMAFLSFLFPLSVLYLMFFATWFAPLLIVFDNLSAKSAMVLSFRAGTTNFRSFVLYAFILGGAWLVYTIGMYMVPGLLLLPLGLGQLLPVAVNLLSVIFWPLAAPVIFLSVYTSYRDVFQIHEPTNPL